ncbi:uncharacterized protein AB675_2990 [Cyphellophora attinorum]|uniref:Uncharacterized protein n=1 Tax=Cyphellophora attinorum TaxID=1664694 RepID=A0A0N0NJD0_9EURO|nr:uncharacterized protein AB675_2990 [Phialophora attinorum]KPI36479.1 hypothetical protein AB675_2990 [Phialophora attinorum]
MAEARQGIDKLRLRILRLQRQAEPSPTGNDVDRSYSEWIRVESVRRTILVSTFAESIFLAATEGVCTTVGFMALLPITVSGALWAAKDEQAWREARTTTGLEVMQYGDAVELWRRRGSDDMLEELQQILVAACMAAVTR